MSDPTDVSTFISPETLASPRVTKALEQLVEAATETLIDDLENGDSRTRAAAAKLVLGELMKAKVAVDKSAAELAREAEKESAADILQQTRELFEKLGGS